MLNVVKKLALTITLFCGYFISFSLHADNASFKKKFIAAEDSIIVENYVGALKILTELNALEPNNANIAFKMGMCYLKSPLQKSKSIPFLEKAAENINPNYSENDYKETKAPDITIQYLAQAYHLANKFDEAIATYEKLKNLYAPSNVQEISSINLKIEMCKTGKELVANPVNILLTNLGPEINSEYPEYAPVISADEQTLIFTSRKPTGTGRLTTEDGKSYEDIYISSKQDGVWTKPMGIANNINSYYHEASIGLSVDAQELFIYKDDNGDGNIYSSKLLGETWTQPIKLGSNINSKSWETHATMSPDGSTLYFVSDRKGGFGGRDIYFCKRLPSGEWGLAQNAGKSINTNQEDDSPFIHPDGLKLYFSSKGHKSMGGFDIFVSNLDSTGKWGAPVNVGYPTNTSDDDIFYAPTTNGKGAYYSSFREGGFGEKDIYLLTFPEQKGAQVTVYKGIIKDIYGKVPEGMRISVFNSETAEPIAPNETPEGKDNEAGRQLNRRIECKLLNYDGNDIRMEKIEIPKITPKPETKGKSAPTNKKKSAPKKK
jgi:tetratricopeptide (TPR) repeat protein